MSLKNILNEYYYRMDSSGLPTSGTMYKRQAVVYREKTIDDWIMSVTAATDPDDPRRGLLYRFFQSLYNDEHLQTTIDNRVLPVQQAKYNLVDDNDNEDEEAKITGSSMVSPAYQNLFSASVTGGIACRSFPP